MAIAMRSMEYYRPIATQGKLNLKFDLSAAATAKDFQRRRSGIPPDGAARSSGIPTEGNAKLQQQASGKAYWPNFANV